MSYKLVQEQFVSGLNGTTLAEVSVQTAFGATSVFLRDSIFILLGVHSTKLHYLFQLTLDFTLLIIPTLLAQTLLSDVSPQFLITLCVCGLLTIPVCIKQFYNRNNNSVIFSAISMLSVEMGMVRPFITNTRSYVLIGTAIAILGVDFKIFPRRLAKAETYGSGLMDVGVGMFVFMNAVVSPEARGKHKYNRSIGNKCVAIIQSLKSSLPLFILGLARMLAIKGTNYQEHVTEYGVHWNFFITLAVTKILSTILFVTWEPAWSGPFSVVLALLYQYWLSCRGLSQYIEHGLEGTGGRQGFFDANREGIYSCVGYLAIYLAGVQIGIFIFKNRTKLGDWLWMFVTLITISAISWCLLLYCQSAIQPISRRMANSTYVIWIVSLGTFVLGITLLEDLAVTALRFIVQPQGSLDRKQHDLLAAVNFNGLLYFLLANMLTGMINMTVSTIYASSTIAFCIIVSYMFVLSAVVMWLFKRNISTKFW